jgi:hypothetical protein
MSVIVEKVSAFFKSATGQKVVWSAGAGLVAGGALSVVAAALSTSVITIGAGILVAYLVWTKVDLAQVKRTIAVVEGKVEEVVK